MARACCSSLSRSPQPNAGACSPLRQSSARPDLDARQTCSRLAVPRPHGWRAWLTLAAALALAALPFLLWQDYLRSRHTSTNAAGQRVIDRPLVVDAEVLSQTLDQVLRGAGHLAALKLGVIISLAVEAANLSVAGTTHRPGGASPSPTRC